MKNKSRTTEKLKALKEGHELPVDVNEMWRSTAVGDVPPTDERAVLGLASAIHYSRSRDWCVSWAVQVEAAAYFNTHGLARTLDEMFRLEASAIPNEDQAEEKQ